MRNCQRLAWRLHATFGFGHFEHSLLGMVLLDSQIDQSFVDSFSFVCLKIEELHESGSLLGVSSVAEAAVILGVSFMPAFGQKWCIEWISAGLFPELEVPLEPLGV